MEIRARGGVSQRPVTVSSVDRVGGLDDCREANAPNASGRRGRQGGQGNYGVQFEPVVGLADGDFRRGHCQFAGHPLAIVAEVVRGPLPGRGKIEFPIGRITVAPDEGLETGVFPEVVNSGRVALCRDAQTNHVAAQAVAEDDVSGTKLDRCVEAADRGDRGRRVRYEGESVRRGGRGAGILIAPCPGKKAGRRD